MAKTDKDLQVLIASAHAGGVVLRRYFCQALDVVEKSTIADFQTKADLESEKAILSILKKEFPTYNIFSEEEGSTNKNSDYTLVIDPLDGTNNFVLGLPNFSVSIALLYKNEGIMGAIYHPIIKQTFTAIKGKGAYFEGKQMKVNNITDPKKLTALYTCGYKESTEPDYLGRIMGALYGAEKKRIMNNWSVAFEFCMLASGKIEAIVADGIELHDFAAGKLIALEAGAKLIDFSGNKEKGYTNSKFIASNSIDVNKYILKIIKPAQESRD